MVKFSKARDELLISLVKSHTILYDTSDENFKNNILKHKNWEEISAVVAVSVPECKKRWKSLRDQYNKKKRGDLIGADRMNSNWEYMNLMSFLSEPIEKPEPPPDETCATNYDDAVQKMVAELLEEKVTDNEDPLRECDLCDDHLSQQTIVNEVQEDPPNTEENVLPRRRHFTRRRLPEAIAKSLAKKRRQRKAMLDKMRNKVPGVKTPTQKFFESMADIVDKLPTHLQAEVRLKVCQTVTEAELKYHTQHDLYPNLQSLTFNQFSNTGENSDISTIPTTQPVSNSNDCAGTPISCSNFNVDSEIKSLNNSLIT